jgi:pimeloyl-ACP methyl ester carboxylesterase
MTHSLSALALAVLFGATLTRESRAAGPVLHDIFSHGAVRIEVLAQGSGPAIVMLPSLGRSGEDYQATSDTLSARGFRVLQPLPRGIGHSEGPMENLDMHALAADVAFAIEQEHAGPVLVVGHAFGNFVARQLATDRPDLVKGVVLAAASAGKAPPGSTEPPIGPELRKVIDGPSDASLPEAKRLEYLKIAFFAPGNDATVWLGGWNEAVHRMESEARRRTPVDDYFAAGSAPILDLQAEQDPVAPRRFAGVLKSLLGDRVTIVVISGASHALFPEQPAAVADAIEAFARRIFAP